MKKILGLMLLSVLGATGLNAAKSLSDLNSAAKAVSDYVLEDRSAKSNEDNEKDLENAKDAILKARNEWAEYLLKNNDKFVTENSNDDNNSDFVVTVTSTIAAKAGLGHEGNKLNINADLNLKKVIKAYVRIKILHHTYARLALEENGLKGENGAALHNLQTKAEAIFGKIEESSQNLLTPLFDDIDTIALPDGIIKKMGKYLGKGKTFLASPYASAYSTIWKEWDKPGKKAKWVAGGKAGLATVGYAGAAVGAGYGLRALYNRYAYRWISAPDARIAAEAEALHALKKDDEDRYEDELARLGSRYSEDNVMRIMDYMDTIK